MAINTTNIKFNPRYTISVSSSGRNWYIYTATAGGTVYSANLAVSVFDYFPNTPTINDAVYIGCRTGSNPSTYLQKWRDVEWNVGTALDGTPTLVWEYYNGSAWTTLTVTNGLAFQTTGAQTVTFTPPTDWVSLNPTNGGPSNNVNAGLFIRCRMTATTGVTEGGAQSATVPKCGNNAFTIIDNVAGTEVTPEDLYDTAVDQAWDVDPIEIADAGGSHHGYYFNCNIEVGREFYHDGGVKTGFLDFKNMTVVLENFCRLESTQNANKINAGTNIEDEAGLGRPRLLTNQSFYCRHQINIRGTLQCFGFSWENRFQGAAPVVGSAGSYWEVVVFGWASSTSQGTNVIDCTFSGFRFFGISVDTANGVIKNTTLTKMEGVGMLFGATKQEIRCLDIGRGMRSITSNSITGNDFVYSGHTFVFSTFAITVTQRARNFVGILPLTTANGCSWGGYPSNTGEFYVQFSVDVEVTDQDGNAISGATVAIAPTGTSEKENNFSTATSAGGTITTQYVTSNVVAQGGGTTLSTITNYDDFTLTITAPGYQDYQYVGTLGEKWDFRIALLPLSPPSVAGGGHVNLAEELVII